jgi:outer membrane immunogenic protein
MNKGIATALVMLAVTAATPAIAQDKSGWTGAYVGGHLGYAPSPRHRNETILFDTNLDGQSGDTVMTAAGANAFSPGFCGGMAVAPTAASGCAKDRDGTDWAVHAGYDIQFSSFVLGVVGEYGRTNISDAVSAFSTTPARYTMIRQMRGTAGLRARAGYAFGNTLLYGTGGGAWAKVRHSFVTSNGVNTFTSTSDDSVFGYRLGGGVEQKITQNFSIGVQYMFTSLKDEHTVRAAGPAPATNPFIRVNAAGTDFTRSEKRFETQSVAITANFRF